MSNEKKQKELFYKVNKKLTRETNLIAQINSAVKGGYETLAAIALYIDEDGMAFPSQAELAKQCGVSRQTINARIKALTEFTTKAGQKVLEAVTVREGLNKTRTFYRLLPASGFTFISDVPDEVVNSALQADSSDEVVKPALQANNSNNEVVSSTLQRQEITEGCEENSKVVKSTLQGVVTKSDRLSNVLDTKKNSVITISNKEEFNIEQDNTPNGGNLNSGNTHFVEERYNKDDINKDLNPNKLSESKTDKIGDYNEYGDNLTPKDIVANNTENKTDISENNDTGHGAGTASSVEPSSESQAVLFWAEEYRKARERDRAKKHEEQAAKERENAASETHNLPDMAVEEVANGKSIVEEKERLEGENEADNNEFLALLKEVQEDFKGMKL